MYEWDNETLGPATYYVIDTDRWAVSNVGRFSESRSPQYKSSSLSQFTNTLDSELFQTARLSASSLRYYGLGLEKGNYTVSLQFAETAIQNGNSWKSLGRRVFDIYIQVCIILSNFFRITVFSFKMKFALPKKFFHTSKSVLLSLIIMIYMTSYYDV